MPLLLHPTRPMPPARANKRKSIARHDSQKTLQGEPEEIHFDMVEPPPPPPKLDMSFDEKALPITPHESMIYPQRPAPSTYRPPPTKKQTGKPSTANRWKAAVGRIIGFNRNKTNKPRYVSPPLSPASSRQPSFYGPAMDEAQRLPMRSHVTLLNSPSDTMHSGYDDDYEGATNIGLSRSSSQNVTPVTTHGPRGFYSDHLEPITTVLKRADSPPSPGPITALPLSPTTPAPPPRTPSPPTREPTPVRSVTPTPPSREYTPPPPRQETPPPRAPSPPKSVRTTKSHRSIPAPEPSRTPSPPPTWPPPGSPPLIITNPSPIPTPATPPSRPRPHITVAPTVKRHQLYDEPRRKRAQTVGVTRVKIPLATTEQPPRSNTTGKRQGTRILQAQLPSPISPDPKNHVFTGPWFNRRGDEWLGISPEPGKYRMREAKEEKAFDPKYINYPEELHHFMNPSGDVMDAQTLSMVSKSPRL